MTLTSQKVHAALFVTGAAVMALEVLGSRVIGPHFGSSLYVWTALIAITLLALAAGYWVGGTLADKGATEKRFAQLIALAGAAVLLIPVLRAPVINVGLGFGVRGGTLVSALILFFPSLFLLGCVTPYGTKLATASLEVVGRSVGRLYAVSTIGSFVGAVGTGFFLVPSLAVSRCLIFVGGALLAAAFGVHFVGGRPTGKGKAAAAVLGLAILVELVVPRAEAGGLLVYHKTSAYGDLHVFDYKEYRLLLMDTIAMTHVERETGNSISPYGYTFVSRAKLARPDAKRALLVGLGGGPIARDLDRMGMTTDAVEIDPDVVDIAQRFFDYKPSGKVYVEDARTFLASPLQRYDVVFIDAYCGERVPLQMVSVEIFRDIRDKALTRGGLVGLNFVGFDDGRLSPGGLAVFRTLSEVFPHVRVFPSGSRAPGEKVELWNVIFLASMEPLEPKVPVVHMATFPHGQDREFKWDGLYRVSKEAAHLGAALTDDFNPLDILDEDVRRRWRLMAISVVPTEARSALLRD